jgi:hypothetical protein
MSNNIKGTMMYKEMTINNKMKTSTRTREKSTSSSEKQKPRPNDNRPNMIVTKNTNTPIARTKARAMTPTGVVADQVLLHRPQQDRKSIPTRKEKTGASR